MSKETAIRKEDSNYIFICGCGKEIKSKPYYFSKHSGKCRSCCVKKKPFEHLYNKLKNTAKHENHRLDLSFEGFLKFTEIKNCHYCNDHIPWAPYAYQDSIYRQGAYFLDRKSNNLGYNVYNCVVACTKCNFGKGGRFTYEEWYGMTEYFRKKLG